MSHSRSIQIKKNSLQSRSNRFNNISKGKGTIFFLFVQTSHSILVAVDVAVIVRGEFLQLQWTACPNHLPHFAIVLL